MHHEKVILITGCASGIGRHLAENLYREGHCLALTDANEKGLQEAAEQNGWTGEKAVVQAMDVTKRVEWEKVIQATLERWNRIDVLMNFAGVIRPGYIHETDFDMIDFHIDINLKGTIYGTKLVSEQMVKQKSGHIINIASMAGLSPVSGLNLYSASKFGVRGFTLSIANELQEHNVAVTVVCPDLVDTPMLTLQLDYPEAALTFSGSRHLTVEEIGQVILDQGFKKKKLEIVHPTGRGLIAKVASFQPKIANLILKKLTEKGLKRQEELKAK
ncbi:MAG: SDR family oxidoreductase [Thermodesulfobacteriota bacterium]